MAASLAVKDNNAFWPRGIPALSYPSAHLVLERLDHCSKKTTTPVSLNPTSVLCLLLYLTHGVRRARLRPLECLPLAGMLLRHVMEGRSGTLRPAGPMLLRRWRELPGADEILTGARMTEPNYVSECFRLAGQVFALGETAFFFAHRLLTERHGPYQIADDLFVSCRHVRHLSASGAVWPEARAVPRLDIDIAIWTFFGAAAARNFSFDMWGNPVFLMDPARDCLGAATYVAAADHRGTILSTNEIIDLRTRLAAYTQEILGVIGRASEQRLAGATESIMHTITSLELGAGRQPAGHGRPLRPPFDFRIDGPLDRLTDYYDWRSDWPPAAETGRT